MLITIVKYEPYQEGMAVGYDIRVKNGRSFYIDTVVPLNLEGEETSEDILNKAWDILKETIENKVSELEQISPLIGSTWVPPTSNVIEENEDSPEDIPEEEEV